MLRALLDMARKASDLSYVYDLDTKRANIAKELLSGSVGNGRVADFGAALRTLLLSDPMLFEEVAYLQAQQKGGSYLKEVYDRFNTRGGADNKNVFERAAAIDATAGAGDSDFATLFVETLIKKRVEAESPLLGMLDQKRLTTTTGKFPTSANRAMAAFAAKSADLTDLTNTVDVGFDHVSVESQKFGGTLFLEAETFVKLNAQTVSQILDELTIAYRRGLIDQIVNGDGNTVNATGLATNATAVTFVGNVTQTLIKMIAAVADSTRGSMEDIFILTNTAGKSALVAEKFINAAYDNLLSGVLAKYNGNEFLKSLNIIEDNVLTTSGSTPNKTAPLYVGKKGDYLYAVQTDPQLMVDPYGDFKAGGETVRIMNFWTGKPYFNDSFAKTTIPTVY